MSAAQKKDAALLLCSAETDLNPKHKSDQATAVPSIHFSFLAEVLQRIWMQMYRQRKGENTPVGRRFPKQIHEKPINPAEVLPSP